MSTQFKLLAIDPALANWGLVKCLVFIDDTGFSSVDVIDMKLVKTAGEAGKTVRKSSDDLRRVLSTYTAALEWALWADMIAAEVPTGSQSSRASFGNGTVVGQLAALSLVKPLIQMNPTEVKKMVTGRKTATKDEMIQWGVAAYPQAKWLRQKKFGVMELIAANEHLADACAIGVTATGTVEFKAAVKMMQSMQAIKLAA